MGLAGLIISLVAAAFLLVGLIPLLGWLNWFTTMPAATLGIILSGIATGRSQSKSRLAITGLIIGIAVFVIALLRLSIGGGII